MDNPVNPLKSTYAPSFLAAYQGSGVILMSVKHQFEMFPVMVTRFWSMLTFAFSAAVHPLPVLAIDERLLTLSTGRFRDCGDAGSEVAVGPSGDGGT